MSKPTRTDSGKISTKTRSQSGMGVHENADNRYNTRGQNETQEMKGKQTQALRTSHQTSPRDHCEEAMDTNENASPSAKYGTGPKHDTKSPVDQHSSALDAVAEFSFNDGASSSLNVQEQEQLLRQAQKQLQRQTEASKQMLYGVFGNVITILEEHEKRTSAGGKGELKQSSIYIPDQSWKTNADVKANVEVQLLLFQSQSKACPEEVRLAVNRELRMKTIAWFGVREASNLPKEETDVLGCKLYEILAQGSTKHEFLDRPREPVTAETIRETLPKIFKGKHDARELDDSFKKDKNKKAETPKSRQAEVDDAYLLGISRIERTDPNLKAFLDDDWSLIQNIGPENIR